MIACMGLIVEGFGGKKDTTNLIDDRKIWREERYGQLEVRDMAGKKDTANLKKDMAGKKIRPT